MEYLDLGMVLAIISVPIVMYYLLTIESEFNKEFNKWWNGQSYMVAFVIVEIFIATVICLLAFVLILFGYPVIATVAIIAKVVISLRNKRLDKINNKKE